MEGFSQIRQLEKLGDGGVVVGGGGRFLLDIRIGKSQSIKGFD